MHLKISQCPDKDIKKLLKEVSDFIMPKLIVLRPRLLNNLKLHVKIDKNLIASKDAYGICYCTDNEYLPRNFIIRLSDTLCKPKLIETYIHELIHVKQYALSELKNYSSGKIKWKDKLYISNPHKITTPWEKEAYRMSESLYNKYYK